VIALNGYDGTAEELYSLNVAAALARGYNALAFDGPGQGAALLQRGITMRPDRENVIGPVMDHLLERRTSTPRASPWSASASADTSRRGRRARSTALRAGRSMP
jgi:alpha-beta hydrolase superfamily lysophospholipase